MCPLWGLQTGPNELLQPLKPYTTAYLLRYRPLVGRVATAPRANADSMPEQVVRRRMPSHCQPYLGFHPLGSHYLMYEGGKVRTCGRFAPVLACCSSIILRYSILISVAVARCHSRVFPPLPSTTTQHPTPPNLLLTKSQYSVTVKIIASALPAWLSLVSVHSFTRKLT